MGAGWKPNNILEVFAYNAQSDANTATSERSARDMDAYRSRRRAEEALQRAQTEQRVRLAEQADRRQEEYRETLFERDNVARQLDAICDVAGQGAMAAGENMRRRVLGCYTLDQLSGRDDGGFEF